jgi:hypothetical protein
MKKQNLIFLAALVIILVTVYMLTNHPFSTIKPELKDFALKNPEKVTKIFLTRKGSSNILLEKNAQGKWILNGKSEAWEPRIELLLFKTMPRLDVKSPVPDIIYNRVINQMALNAVKAEFYEGNKKVKCIYVGDNTADELGTYMYIEGSDKPFVVHIPGFNGFLSSRFTLDEKDWKTRTIVSVTPPEVLELRMDYISDPVESFAIIREQNDSLHLIGPRLDGKNIPPAVVTSYVNQFRSLSMEGFPNTYSQRYVDSLLSTPALCRIFIVKKDRSTKEVLIYPKPTTDENTIYDKNGNVISSDPERYYAFIDRERTPVIIQKGVFEKVIIKASQFEKVASQSQPAQ